VKKDDEQKDCLHQWIKDYKLVEWGKQTLFYEYLEMGKPSSSPFMLSGS